MSLAARVSPVFSRARARARPHLGIRGLRGAEHLDGPRVLAVLIQQRAELRRRYGVSRIRGDDALVFPYRLRSQPGFAEAARQHEAMGHGSDRGGLAELRERPLAPAGRPESLAVAGTVLSGPWLVAHDLVEERYGAVDVAPRREALRLGEPRGGWGRGGRRRRGSAARSDPEGERPGIGLRTGQAPSGPPDRDAAGQDQDGHDDRQDGACSTSGEPDQCRSPWRPRLPLQRPALRGRSARRIPT